jgi:hypothetical protein
MEQVSVGVTLAPDPFQDAKVFRLGNKVIFIEGKKCIFVSESASTLIRGNKREKGERGSCFKSRWKHE